MSRVWHPGGGDGTDSEDGLEPGRGSAAALENRVAYAIFPDKPDRVDDVQQTFYAVLRDLVPDYVWQRDVPHIFAVDQGSSGACARGAARFGDCVDDEWVLVGALVELTRRLPETTAFVWDNDGEFLLIEASDVLPDWVRPETAERRVAIRRGRVVLLRGGEAPPANRAQVAAELQQEPDNVSEASASIHSIIYSRVEDTLGRVGEVNSHWKRCRLPLALAGALAERPQSVASLVEAFCTRDALQARAAARMRAFPPPNRAGDSQEWVVTSVRFTQCLYAQLVGQPYSAPRAFVTSTVAANASSEKSDQATSMETERSSSATPSTSSASEGSGMAVDDSAWDLGLRIAAGAEILLHAQRLREQRVAAEGNRKPVSAAFRAYLTRLERGGFFDGALPGSKERQEREERAAAAFRGTDEDDDTSGAESRENALETSTHLLEVARAPDRARNALQQVPGRDDADDFLSIDPESVDVAAWERAGRPLEPRDVEEDGSLFDDLEEVDELRSSPRLALQAHNDAPTNSMDVTSEQGVLDAAARGVKAFLEYESAPEGAEVPRASATTDDDPFRADAFLDALSELLGADDPTVHELRSDLAAADSNNKREKSVSWASGVPDGPGGGGKADDEDDRGDTYVPGDGGEGLLGADGDASDAGFEAEATVEDVMEQMDSELRATEVGRDFRRQGQRPDKETDAAVADGLAPLDVDLNLVENLVQSFEGQEGEPGPAGTMLGALGVHLPPPERRAPDEGPSGTRS